MKLLISPQSKKTKRLFLVFGVINFLITNITLQILLLFLPTLFATVLSQLVNFLIGYYLYGKKVFNIAKLNSSIFRKYLILSVILWLLNFGFIELFFYYGMNKNLSAIIIIPFLVSLSYLSQKYLIFR